MPRTKRSHAGFLQIEGYAQVSRAGVDALAEPDRHLFGHRQAGGGEGRAASAVVPRLPWLAWNSANRIVNSGGWYAEVEHEFIERIACGQRQLDGYPADQADVIVADGPRRRVFNAAALGDRVGRLSSLGVGSAA